MIKHILISFIAMAAAVAPAMAGIDDLPVTTVGGRSYHYYDVEPKQTIYSICRDLGISKAQLLEANPEVAEKGVKAYQRLLFPVAGSTPDIHVVGERETIYGIASRYGLTPSQLDAWNPGIRDGIRKGDRLIVSDPSANGGAVSEVATSAPQQSSGAAPVEYVVKDKETFYSIAHSHGISVGDLEAANPEVTLLRPGMKLVIPAAGSAASAPAATPSNVVTLPTPSRPEMPTMQPSNPPVAVEAPAEVAEASAVNIAVVLPFMLNDSERNRRADLITEFYKGFLLAVDSLRHSDKPIHIQTYDTEGDAATLRSIMARPELAEAQVIIAPDNAAHLESLAAYGADHGIDVLNLFVVADGSYVRTPHLYQATIPHDAMYSSAIEAMTRHFAEGYKPVILSATEGSADKQPFVDQLTSALRRAGIDYATIDYNGILGLDDLASLDRDGRYAFIPTSSRQADLNRVLPALIELKGAMSGYDPVRLYGYPEWTTFRGETLTNMHTVNTYVYSRFFTSPEDPWAKRVEDAYERWYGQPMAAAVPRQGLLGFDTGMFLIPALAKEGSIADAPVYHGVQNAFRFIRPAGVSGQVNDDLYFVNFRPSGLTDRISL